MLSNWVSFLAYPNLFEIKDFVVVVVCIQVSTNKGTLIKPELNLLIFKMYLIE
jgi:hypothetical protein